MTDEKRVIDTTKPTEKITSGGTGEASPQHGPIAEPAVYHFTSNGDTEMPNDEPKSYSDPNTTFTSIQAPVSSMYTVKIEPLGTDVKSNAEAFAGLAAHETWTVSIFENDKWFASVGCSIWRLNEQNTVPANRWLQAKSSDKLVVVDHDVKEADLINHLPKKVVDLLAKLNA